MTEEVSRRKLYEKEYRAKNKERLLENTRRYRERNKEKIQKAGREYHHKRKGLIATRPRPDLCECCGGPPIRDQVLHLDHCHITGKFRGWICMKCNSAIGQLGDTLTGAQKAVKYLEQNG